MGHIKDTGIAVLSFDGCFRILADRRPLRISGMRFWEAGCPSCHPTDSVIALRSQSTAPNHRKSPTYTLKFSSGTSWLVRRLTSPFSTKTRLCQGQGLGWRFSSARLRMANDTPPDLVAFLVQRRPKMGKDRGSSLKLSVIMLAPTTGWKLTNHHKTYLSVQCDILCNCCSSVPITYQYLTTLVLYIFSVLVWLWMLLLSKTQEKHPGDLPPTVPDLPLHLLWKKREEENQPIQLHIKMIIKTEEVMVMVNRY